MVSTAEQIDAVLQQWYRDASQIATDWYLVFEDFGLVEPLYDPMSTAGSIEEEWEIFQ